MSTTVSAAVILGVAAAASPGYAPVVSVTQQPDAAFIYPEAAQAYGPAHVPAPARHRPRSYRVKRGDDLGGISKRFCGTAADYPSLAAASGISNPDAIYPGELVRLACHAAYTAILTASSSQPITPAQPPAQLQPPAAPVVTGFSGTLSFSGLEALWLAAGGPASAEYQAAAVAECESGGNQYAQNPSGASGYWQILGEVVLGNVFDPMVNAENAVAKFEASGGTFAQWVCQP